MTTEVGTLVIELKAQVARLEADMKKVAQGVKRGTDQIESGAKVAKNALLGLAAALGVNQLKSLIENSFQTIDVTTKMADRLGVATERMGGLMHQADLAGVSNETLNTGLRTMVKTVADAAQGIGDGARAFRTLHLSAQDLLRLAPDQQLKKILDALAGMENVTLRNAAAAQIFGSRATEMLNFINEGSEGIRKATEDAQAWGLALNRVDSAKIEQANDAVTRAKGAFQGILNTIAVQLAPIVTAIANGFADSAKEANGFRDQVINGMETVTQVVAYTANVVRGLQVVWSGIKQVVAEAINVIIQTLQNLDHTFTDVINKFAGSWVGRKMGLPLAEYSKVIDEVAEVSTNRIAEMRVELETLVMQEMPADKVLAWFEKVRTEAQKSAEDVAANRSKMIDAGTGGTSDLGQSAFDKNRERYLADLAKRSDALEQSLQSDFEKERSSYQERVALLEDATRQFGDIDGRYYAAREQLELEHQAKLGNLQAQGILERQKFERMTTVDQIAYISGTLQSLTASSAAQNKKMFQINQAAGIANATVSMYTGATKALELGPFLGPVMAAAIIAAGIANIQQIANAKFGGGTSAPSAAGGNAIPVTPAGPSSGFNPVPSPNSAGAGESLTIIVQNHGTVVGSNGMQELSETVAGHIRDFIDNRDGVLISRNSRQAQELAQAGA